MLLISCQWGIFAALRLAKELIELTVYKWTTFETEIPRERATQ
jgi:hypothetical protein